MVSERILKEHIVTVPIVRVVKAAAVRWYVQVLRRKIKS